MIPLTCFLGTWYKHTHTHIERMWNKLYMKKGNNFLILLSLVVVTCRFVCLVCVCVCVSCFFLAKLSTKTGLFSPYMGVLFCFVFGLVLFFFLFQWWINITFLFVCFVSHHTLFLCKKRTRQSFFFISSILYCFSFWKMNLICSKKKKKENKVISFQHETLWPKKKKKNDIRIN